MLRSRTTTHVSWRTLSRSYSSQFTRVKSFNGGPEDVNSLDFSEPMVFPKQFADVPAIRKWFMRVDNPPNEETLYDPDMSYLGRHGSLMVPLELTRHNPTPGLEEVRTSIPSFERFEAPLSLLLTHINSEDCSQQLYLAQCSLDDLPDDLRNDLPTPALLSRIGRGDIYASSIWMGRPPTSTPLHRDPNPNLFVQLVGRKVIRLMRPKQGRLLYERLSQKGHAHMRSEEMMVGEERDRLQKTVWKEEEVDGMSASGVEARLEGGDGLYIPLGWWHAVESYGTHTNASVNWWFR